MERYRPAIIYMTATIQVLVDDEKETPEEQDQKRDTRYVCTRRYYSERYDPPAPVGFCAENY